MDIKTRIIGLTHLFAAIFFASALASCNRIFEQEGDCSLHCTLKFRYDMNMKFADAFSNSVSHIEVYVYDTETGALFSSRKNAVKNFRQKITLWNWRDLLRVVMT